MAVTHEYVVFSFQAGIDKEEQFEIMRALTPLLAECEGFQQRDIFYSEADNRWLDHVIWATKELAQASLSLLNDPVAGPLFAKMDPATTVFSLYEKVD